MTDGPPADYRDLLDVSPGTEDSRFYILLTQFLPYRAHPGGQADIAAWLETREAIPNGGEGTTFLEWLSHVAPTFLDLMPAHPHYIVEFGEEFVEQMREAFAPILSGLLIDVRMHGATIVPASWAKDNVAGTWSSQDLVRDPRRWYIYSAGGVAYYLGQKYAEFDALRAFARDLFAAGGHTPAIDAAFHLWDVTGMLVSAGEWGGVVDALSLAEDLPAMHPRGRALLQSYNLVTASSPGVRQAAARFLHRHPHVELMPAVTQALLPETSRTLAAPLVVALRVMGGEAAFDALVQVATQATADETRRLAARALASVEYFPDRQRRITRLILDRDPARRTAGTTALSESKHGSIFDEGGILATAAENRSPRQRPPAEPGPVAG